MAKKIYRTKRNIISYSAGLIIRGRKHFVEFAGGVNHPRYIPSTFTTEDEDVQRALEAWPTFGADFELVYTEKPIKKKKEDETKGLKKIHQVTSIPQAISNLIKNGYMGSTEELVDNESVQAAAKTIGVVYTKL